MIPILYKETQEDFSGNGIGLLKDTMVADVTEVANGEFSLYLEYPIEARYSSDIDKFKYIKQKPNTVDEPHIFRIYNLEKDTLSGVMRVYASSRSNDMGKNFVRNLKVAGTPQTILNSMKAQAELPVPYTFHSDISSTNTVSWENRNLLNSIVGEEGSLIDVFGGELKRGNNDIWLYRRRGNDNVTTLRDGKNIRGIESQDSIEGLITRIVPFYTYTEEDTDQERIVWGNAVDSPLINNYPEIYAQPVDFSSEAETLSELNSIASTYFETKEIDKPSLTLTVDLLEIFDSVEYERFKDLEKVNLFDTITVYSKKYNVNVNAKVNTIIYDSLREINKEVSIGTYVTGLWNEMSKDYSDRLREVENKIVTYVQTSANGLNKTYRGTEDPNTAGIIGKENDSYYRDMGENRTQSWQYENNQWNLILDTSRIDEAEQAIAEAQKQADADRAKAEADTEQALTDAKAHAESEDARIKQEIGLEVDGAIEIAEQAKQDAIDKANQALADAKAHADTEISSSKQHFDGLIEDTQAEVANAQATADSAVEQIDTAVANVGFTSLDDTLTNMQSLAETAETAASDALSDVQTAIKSAGSAEANAATALSNAQTAISNAQNALDAQDTLETDVEAEISRIDGELSSKVSQTTYDSLAGTVKTVKTLAYQNQTDVGLKADQSFVDTLQGTVDTHTLDIKANSEGLAAKAEKSIVDTLSGDVSSLETDFSLMAGELKSKITQTQLQGAIDEIEVGGRNLIPDSVVAVQNHSDGTFELVPNIETPYGISKVGKFTTTNENTSRSLIRKDDLLGRKDHGETFTFSFYARTVNDGETATITFDIADQVQNKRNATIDNNWKKLVISETYNYRSDVYSFVDIGVRTHNVPVYIAFWKLEKGNKATDWTPAPEDTTELISSVQSEFVQRAGSIEATISSIETNLDKKATIEKVNSIESTVDGTVQRIASIETDVDSKASTAQLNEIKSTVDGTVQTISTIQTDLDKKATVTAVNSIKDTVDGTVQSISDIEGNVTTIESTVKGHTTSISDAEGNISRQEQRIDGLQTNVSNAISGLETEVSTIAEGFRVLSGDFENLEVGGRNYFSLIRLNNISPSSWVVNAYVYNFTLEPNTKYILSSNVPTDGDSSETVLYFNGSRTSSNGVWLNNPRIMETDNEGKLYVAILTGRTYTDEILNGNYWVQLEKGNKATDWTPAPEDMATYNQLQVTKDGILAQTVLEGEVVAQINQEAGRTLIQSNSLVLDGNTIVRGSFGVSGGNVTLNADTRVQGDFVVSGGNVVLDGNTTVLGGFAVLGENITLDGNTTVLDNFTVTGGNIILDGNTTVHDNFTVTGGNVVLNADTRVQGGFTVSGGNVILDGNTAVRGTFTVLGENVTLDGNTSVLGDFSVFGKNITLDGDTTILGDFSVFGKNITLDGDTTVTGDFTVGGELVGSGITADNITAGTLNAANVNVINLNADNMTTGTINKGNLSSWDLLTGLFQNTGSTTQMRIQDGGIHFYGKNDGIYYGGLDLQYFSSVNQSSLTFVNARDSDPGLRISQNKIETTQRTQNADLYLTPALEGEVAIQSEVSRAYYGVRAKHYNLENSKIYETSGGQLNVQAFSTLVLRQGSGAYAMSFDASQADLQRDLDVTNHNILDVRAIEMHYGSDILELSGGQLEIRAQTTMTLRQGSGTYAVSINADRFRLQRTLDMAGNSITNQSDGRFKKNIEESNVIELDLYRKLRFVTYEYTHEDMAKGVHFGLIAQEAGHLGFYDPTIDKWQINSSEQIMHNSKAIQEVVNLQDKLENKLFDYDAKIWNLEIEVKELKKQIQELKGAA